MKFKGKNITVNNKKIFYWEYNSNATSSIVFLHGFPGSHVGLMGMAKEIKKYRLIIPDLPACGQSEPLIKKHSLKNYASWLKDFLESLSIHETIIIGHSFGSRLALVFTMHYPEKVQRLVLITPVTIADSMIDKLGLLYYRTTKVLPLSVQEKWLHNKIYHYIKNQVIIRSKSINIKKRLIRINYEEIKDLDMRANLEIFNEFYQSALMTGGTIKVKTLIIAADKDKVATLQSIKLLYGSFMNAELKVVKNAGHLVVLEKSKTTGALINTWLS